LTQGATTITYDGDGNRVEKSVNGIVTKYLVDDGINPTGYSQVVIEDSTLNGGEEEQYVYGLERISQRWSPTSGTWNVSFYGYDGHGSVRFVTDPTGAVTDTYDYDAFGNLLHITGTTPDVYRFAAEQWDPDLNLYYNRARYLNTATGRFWSVDMEEGVSTEPLSLHRYLYTTADPVNMVDPSGNDGELAETIGTIPIAQTIATLTVLTLATACVALFLIQHGPGFCGSENQPLTLYRGRKGKNPGQLKPEYFRGDGLSLYEELFPGRYKFKLPFEIDYLPPKSPGTQAAHIYIPPFLDAIANITYTPEFEDPAIGKGHWSLQMRPGIALTLDILKLMIDYMKSSSVPF
jgi:RHS repeat-associated protein